MFVIYGVLLKVNKIIS